MGKIKKEECEAIYISKHHHSKLRKVMEDYYSSYKTSRLKIINSTEFVDVLDHMGNLYIEGCIDKMYSARLFFIDFATFLWNCLFLSNMYSVGFIMYATSISTEIGAVERFNTKLDLCVPPFFRLKSHAKFLFIISANNFAFSL